MHCSVPECLKQKNWGADDLCQSVPISSGRLGWHSAEHPQCARQACKFTPWGPRSTAADAVHQARPAYWLYQPAGLVPLPGVCPDDFLTLVPRALPFLPHAPTHIPPAAPSALVATADVCAASALGCLPQPWRPLPLQCGPQSTYSSLYPLPPFLSCCLEVSESLPASSSAWP